MAETQEEQFVFCPSCGWETDELDEWKCTCGYTWNIFTTQGRCPNCQRQWGQVQCLKCKEWNPLHAWQHSVAPAQQPTPASGTIEPPYRKSLETPTVKALMDDPDYSARYERLEQRLLGYGIPANYVNYPSTYAKERFKDTLDAGKRMLVLYAVAYCAHELAERDHVCQWLQEEELWDEVSQKELEFLAKPSPTEQEQMDFSWRMEGALVLGWCLNVLPQLPSLDGPSSDNKRSFELFFDTIPQLGGETRYFLMNLEYRNLTEVYEENLVNEAATSYFRDLMFMGGKDTTRIDRYISFERHRTLNWLRTVEGYTGWDHVDTST